MKQIRQLFQHVQNKGVLKQNRTGVDTISVFGYQMRFDLADGFPLVTGKKTPFKLIASELLWFLKGRQDKPGAIEDLHADNNHIWDEWVKADGSFGPIYGVQWRRWGERVGIGGIDQINELIIQLSNNPTSRRLIVTAWQPSEIADMALPPCHVLFQLNTRPRHDAPGYWVDLQLYQRSCDCFLGVPFNVASYALLLHMICHCAKNHLFYPGELVWTGGDVHLYTNHLDQVEEYLSRESFLLPGLLIDPAVRNIDDIKLSDISLVGYQSHPAIKAEVAV